MRRWFLSYNTQDLAVVQGLEAALKRKDPEAQIFFAPKSLRAGGYWLPELAKEIAEATAFVLLVGEQGLGPWQVIEYYEALDRRVKAAGFPVVLVLLEGQPAPGLPFLRQLHWIVTPEPASEPALARLVDATAGAATRPGELWRHTAPYRGLAAMTEADSDFFFGRASETVEVIRALDATPDKLPILLGNSGVGKSSLAQAGVLAALARQAWPDTAEAAGAWPQAFRDSRRWCFLNMRPGTEPLKALIEPFLRTWQLDATDPLWARRRVEWIEALAERKLSLPDLLDATERRYEQLGQPKPAAFFLYVDQGEELYVRAEERQRSPFSAIVGHGLGDPRLRALMSLRADFFGALQNDEPLYAAHRQINVPPLREAELREVVNRPAALLSARFETEGLAADIARRTAEESAKDAGALPLLSYLLDDMWTQMVARGDGMLRLPAQAVELGGVLAERANAFLANRPGAEDQLRRLLTLKLATVRQDGEPTRRRALRSEFSEEEWRLVSELADHPHRLLVTATPEEGETYAEVAHEAIFRRWQKLRDWMVAERDFLVWKAQLEADRRRFEAAPAASKNDALLMGLALSQAQGWLAVRAGDLSHAEREFIDLSLKRETLEREHRERLRRRVLKVTAAALALVMGFAAFSVYQWFEADQLRGEAEAKRIGGLLNESRRLEDVANQAMGRSDSTLAALLALEGLPDARGSERPYLASLEATLYQAASRMREALVLNNAVSATRYIAAINPDGSATIYDRESARPSAVLKAASGRIVSMAFSGDNRRVVTGSSDGAIAIWETASGRELALLTGHQGAVESVAFGSRDPDLLLSISADRTVRLWTISERKPLHILPGHDARITSVTVRVDMQRAITVTESETIRLWDVPAGKELTRLDGLPRSAAPEDDRSTVSSRGITVSFSSDNRSVLIGRSSPSSADTMIALNAANGTELGRFDRMSNWYFMGQGRTVNLYGGYGGRQFRHRVWDVETRRMIVDVPNETRIESMADRFLVWSRQEKTARLWNADTAEPIGELPGLEQPLTAVHSHFASSRLEHFVTVSKDGKVQVWDPNGRLLRSMGDGTPVESSNLWARGRRLMSRSDSSLKLWNLDSGEKLLDIGLGSGTYQNEHQRQRFAMRTDDDRVIRIWDIETGFTLPLIKAENNEKFETLNFSGDGTRIAARVGPRTARVWEIETGRVVGTIRSLDDLPSYIQLSVDGQRLVASSSQSQITRVWDVSSGRDLGTLATGSTPAFSPAAASFMVQESAFTGRLNRTQIWRADDSPTRFFHEPLRKISHLAASRGAQNAVIAVVMPTTEAPSVTPEIRDSRTGQLIRVLGGHRSDVRALGFSHDGRRAVSLSEANTAAIWDPETGRAIAVAGARSESTLGMKALFLKSGEHDLSLWDVDKAASTAMFKGAAENLHSATFNPDERFGLVHAGDVARLIDVASGREIARWDAVAAASFDNERVIVVLKDGSATLIDIATARTIARVDAAPGKVHAVQLGARFVLLAFEDGTVRLLDGVTGARRAEFQASGPLTKGDRREISDDGGRIVLWSPGSAQLELRNGETGAQIAVMRHDPSVVISRFLIADGRRLVTVDQGKAVLFDSETGKVIRQLEGGAGQPTTAVHVSEARGRILTIAKDGEARTSDALSGAPIARLPGSGQDIVEALFSPDGVRVAMKTSDETVRLWDPETGSETVAIKSEPHHDAFVRFSKDGDRFLFVRNRRFPPGAETVQLLDPSGQPLRAIEHPRPVKAVVVSPDGNRVLTVTSDSVVQLWSAANGQRVIRHEGNLSQVWSAFSKDGRRLAVVSASSGGMQELKVQILDSGSGRILGSSTGGLMRAVDAKDVTTWFGPDGRHLVVLLRQTPSTLLVFNGENASVMTQNDGVPMSGADTGLVDASGKWLLVTPASDDRNLVQVWDSVAAKAIAAFSTPKSITSAAFSPDGRYLAVGSLDNLVRLWELPSGSPIGPLSGHTGNVSGVAFSADGQLLLSGSDDGTVRAWRVPSGELVKTLQSDAGVAVRDVFFLSDPRRVAGQTDRGVRIWDLQTGEQLALVEGLGGKPEVGIDDRYLVSHSPDEAVVRRIFRSTQELVETVQAASPRCLTPTERKAHFLNPEPPAWCIDMGKWPYRSAAWNQWLADRKAGKPTQMPAE